MQVMQVIPSNRDSDILTPVENEKKLSAQLHSCTGTDPPPFAVFIGPKVTFATENMQTFSFCNETKHETSCLMMNMFGRPRTFLSLGDKSAWATGSCG